MAHQQKKKQNNNLNSSLLSGAEPLTVLVLAIQIMLHFLKWSRGRCIVAPLSRGSRERLLHWLTKTWCYITGTMFHCYFLGLVTKTVKCANTRPEYSFCHTHTHTKRRSCTHKSKNIIHSNKKIAMGKIKDLSCNKPCNKPVAKVSFYIRSLRISWSSQWGMEESNYWPENGLGRH